MLAGVLLSPQSVAHGPRRAASSPGPRSRLWWDGRRSWPSCWSLRDRDRHHRRPAPLSRRPAAVAPLALGHATDDLAIMAGTVATLFGPGSDGPFGVGVLANPLAAPGLQPCSTRSAPWPRHGGAGPRRRRPERGLPVPARRAVERQQLKWLLAVASLRGRRLHWRRRSSTTRPFRTPCTGSGSPRSPRSRWRSAWRSCGITLRHRPHHQPDRVVDGRQRHAGVRLHRRRARDPDRPQRRHAGADPRRRRVDPACGRPVPAAPPPRPAGRRPTVRPRRSRRGPARPSRSRPGCATRWISRP